VEFQITVAPKGPPCPPKAVSFQMDFGDGTHGQPVTIPAGGAAYTYTEVHTYSGADALQDNNAALTLSQPPECAGTYGSVIIPRCCKKKRAALCVTLFWTMSWAFTLAALALLSWLFGSLYSPRVSLQAFFALASIGVAILIAFLILCTKCRCGWVWRLLWRVFFAAGLLYAIFAACTVFHWQSVLIGFLMILLAFLFLRKWRRKCCVSECAWLREIIFWFGVNVLTFVGLVLTHPILVHCQMVLFAIGSFTITVLTVAIFLFSLITAYYLKKCT
jgi:MFS family permease